MLNLLSATTARVRIEPMKKKGNVRSKVDLNTSAQWLKIWRWQHILDSVCAAQNKAINIYIYIHVCVTFDYHSSIQGEHMRANFALTPQRFS